MIVIGAVALLGFLLVLCAGIFTFTPNIQDIPKESLEFSGKNTVYIIALTIFQYVGFAFTSTMFNELNSKASAPQFFTLPATSSEKLLSASLISYVGYTIFAVTCMYLFSLILGVVQELFLREETFSQLLSYIVFQSIYFFGAAYFKSNNFLNTLVATMVVGLTGVLSMLAFKAISLDGYEWFKTNFIPSETYIFANDFVYVTAAILISGLFMWFTYLRLQNRQIA